MTLSRLLEGVTVSKMFHQRYGQMLVTSDLEIRALQYDSRKVQHGDAFVAIRGTSSDGNAFITTAIDRGAIVAITDNDAAVPDSYFLHTSVAKIVVPHSRIALGQMSSTYYDHPSRKLTMIGITGTNGKTTTSQLVRTIAEATGTTAGLIGTIEYIVGTERIPATHTTPESLELNELLARMVQQKCSAAVMEVSSHALDQHRVEGIQFDCAVFTNLTQDHLDYHGSMGEYFNAKKILFDNLSPGAPAVINVDDQWGKKLLEMTGAPKLSYGMVSPADVRATNISLSLENVRFIIEHESERTEIQSPLVGLFNVSNILAAFATGITLGISKATMQQALRTAQSARGRFERIVSPKGYIVVIDYAHTPDALEKALLTVHNIVRKARGHRIITVFGCGGNRDAQKRPMMGRIASELSDVTIVTSDNPRHERPDSIIDGIMTGVKPGSVVFREPDRRTAVRTALGMAQPGDVVLIAGKGHEEYQIIEDKRIHFSDREIVEEYFSPRS